MNTELDKTTGLFYERSTGRYVGPNPTETERASGEIIEAQNRGLLKPGKAGHLVLNVYGDRQRHTAYGASWLLTGDHHARRRESTRLLERGFLVKDGTLPNRAVNGKAEVDAYRITAAGLVELARLGDL